MSETNKWRSVTAWEYDIVGLWWDELGTTCELRQLGDAGWELTSIIPMTATSGRAMFYFKRPNGFAHVEYDSTGRNVKGEYGGSEF